MVTSDFGRDKEQAVEKLSPRRLSVALRDKGGEQMLQTC
jgi:hypothetical protein